jgi:transcriptional regulator with XRE-family HTH domain
MTREFHPICKQLRDFRKTAKMSLAEAEKRFGVSAIVLGSYERGDRNPPLRRLEEILNFYGYTVAAIPKEFDAIRLTGDIVRELRAIANQLEWQERGEVSPPPELASPFD